MLGGLVTTPSNSPQLTSELENGAEEGFLTPTEANDLICGMTEMGSSQSDGIFSVDKKSVEPLLLQNKKQTCNQSGNMRGIKVGQPCNQSTNSNLICVKSSFLSSLICKLRDFHICVLSQCGQM
ncbi:uncharacterized protein LOC121235425 [Juglans microcarpa x Juglans regia]|uniref:uncharacterized protein LOC121235425 n=1 Tax=Juglans microcarpa x Juglans regia TaxID=2249226 RepID=UPI001B7E8610|nr:uncharacterized protein LOC121235425 [Juglans microcarpa x Juglans regia]